MEDRNKIMKRLEALLNLKTSRGATQAEMETAMSKAQEIAFKYRISLDEIKANDEGSTRVGADMVKRKFRTLAPKCHKYLNDILNKFFGVKTCNEDQSNTLLHIVGTPKDVDFAIYAYAFLRVTFLKLWEWQKFEDQLTDRDMDSFYYGLWQGLCLKLSSEKVSNETKASAVNAYAMVLIDEHALALKKRYDEEFPDAVTKRASSRKVNAEVAASGREIGQSLAINKAIGGGNARL